MLLALIACQIALVAASPFHKYPYVFLLDVGNEELEKTSTEQIRLSIPGGSLALRYPAVGTGDTIAHVRVSGIDFGNDLKASIVDGGPGYKYVVLVFMGNQGVPYDAVMTVQTVADEDLDEQSNSVNTSDKITKDPTDNNDSSEIDVSNNDVAVGASAVDENVSSEDTNDELDSDVSDDDNVEIVQQSSSVNSEADSSIVNNDADDESSNENEKDIHIPYRESDQDIQVQSYSVVNNDNSQVSQTRDNYSDKPHYHHDYSYEQGNYNIQTARDKNIKDRYQSALPPLRIFGGAKIYPQNAVPFAIPSVNSVYGSEDQNQIDQMINDEDRNDDVKTKDSNNNNFDPDDEVAAEY